MKINVMVDSLTPKQRHQCMSNIKGKDTKPEIIVRKLIFSFGYRYRLHCRDLPGCPDIIFPKLKKIIFVNGCFWHLHNCSDGQSRPKTNRMFWESKLEKNRERDRRNIKKLKELGWEILVIWECQTVKKKYTHLNKRILSFLEE